MKNETPNNQLPATDGKPPVVGNDIDWDYVMIYVSMVAFAVIWVIAMLV
jgi:hypothetical protein